MKKFFLLIAGISFLLTSCIKDKGSFTKDQFAGNNGQKTVQIHYGGLANYTAAAVIIPGDHTGAYEIKLPLYLASSNINDKDVQVTIESDDAARISYVSKNPEIAYEPLPASANFELAKTTYTIKSGKAFDTALVVIKNPEALDPTKSYMFPISIKSANGASLTSNYRTIYYHIIGNPIAGSYTWDYTRWNNGSGTGTPSSSWTGEHATFIPASPSMIEVESGYVGIRYQLSFTDENGTLSDFKVKMNPDDVEDAGVSIIDGPRIIKADPVTGEFIFQFKANNGTADRYLIDRFYK